MNISPSAAGSKGGLLTLRVPENLVSTSAARFREEFSRQLDAAAAACPVLVEVNLSGARFVDSVGLNLLVTVIKRVGAWGGKTRLQVDDPNVNRTLRFTRLDAHAEIVLLSR
jgi:anti-anti-sigma factor